MGIWVFGNGWWAGRCGLLGRRRMCYRVHLLGIPLYTKTSYDHFDAVDQNTSAEFLSLIRLKYPLSFQPRGSTLHPAPEPFMTILTQVSPSRLWGIDYAYLCHELSSKCKTKLHNYLPHPPGCQTDKYAIQQSSTQHQEWVTTVQHSIPSCKCWFWIERKRVWHGVNER